jgi:hypothetical protein
MGNARIVVVLVFVGLGVWWALNRGPGPTPPPVAPEDVPRSAAGQVVHDAGDRAQRANDAYGKRMGEATDE